MTSWNTGLTKETDKRVANQSKSLKLTWSNNPSLSRGSLGKHWNLSDEAKRNHSIARSGKSGTLKGRLQSSELIIKRMEGRQRFYETHPQPRWEIPKDSQQYQNISKHFFGKGRPASFPKEKNGNWKGGIAFEPYGSEFTWQYKQLIKQRDGYTCQICGVPECECKSFSCIHHIDYDKKNNLPTNLITLCNSCNSKVNWNREYWKTFLMLKMKDIQEGYQLKLELKEKTDEELVGIIKEFNNG